jgi:hypothetical protein
MLYFLPSVVLLLVHAIIFKRWIFLSRHFTIVYLFFYPDQLSDNFLDDAATENLHTRLGQITCLELVSILLNFFASS